MGRASVDHGARARRPAVSGGRHRGAGVCQRGRWSHRRGRDPPPRGGSHGRGPVRSRNWLSTSTRPSTSPAPSSIWTAIQEAEAHADRAMAVGLATGQSELVPLAYSILGQVKLLRGQLAEAADLLDNAVDGARLSGNVQALAGNLLNRSLTAVAAGDIDLALSTAQEAVELTDGLDQSMVCAAGVAMATALLETGNPGRAVDVLLRSVGGRRAPAPPRRVEGQISGAANPVLARARPPRRGRTRRIAG